MARVFVGNLPENVHERDLVDKFDRFGRIASVRIKIPTRPPPFAFITYENEQDATNAVRSMNNPRGTQYRVKISGLPETLSWQDLKDFLREGGDVVHSDVDRRGNGTASFATQEELRRAIRKLDGADLDGGRVRIREMETEGRSLSSSRSRSRSPPRRLSRRRSPSRSRSRSPRRHGSSRNNRRGRDRSR